MNREDIVRMAREAGLFVHKEVQPEIERFAALVAADEREACAKVCDVLADDYGKAGLPMTYQALTATAKEIRARGQQELAEASVEPVAWRELCRRLYIELYWCDRQMMETLDADGEPMWTQGKTVRDVLADAKAALETSPPASKPWVGLTELEALGAYEAEQQGRWGDHVRGLLAVEAKLREKNA